MDKLPFNNTYRNLPPALFTAQEPTPVKAPTLIAFNDALGNKLGIDRAVVDEASLAEVFSGNRLLPGSEPIAAAYAGHQFGHWSGQLGDGRAILLGEIQSSDGERLDIQLKGAGRTPYSRGGDGRAWLGPVLREYLLSNAMPRFGVASTTALAAVLTGESVLREEGPLPGAILTRVATSHVRVGTFEFLAAHRDTDSMRRLVGHLITHHFPELSDTPNPALSLLQAIIRLQVDLVARWQGLGFIHGVMNTDNASVVGITIDYGPCAFMDTFNRAQVFSSIDQQGRYAYQNQPAIAHWNMAMLAQSMLPILADQEEQALSFAQHAVDEFPTLFAASYSEHMRTKIGLFDVEQSADVPLLESLLDLMQRHQVDFTLCFRALSDAKGSTFFALFDQHEDALAWHERWLERLGDAHDSARMNAINPAVIPRNHWVEACIQAAVQGDWTLFHRFDEALHDPFTEHAEFSQAPQPEQRVQATFCGT